MRIDSHNRRLSRLEEKRGISGPLPHFALQDWADGCPRAFQPWEMDQIANFEEVARDKLVSAGKIQEHERDKAQFILNVIVYPPEREDEDERYRRVRLLLRQMSPELKAQYEEMLGPKLASFR